MVLFPLTLRAGEKIIIGGFAPNTLKKLNGDKFGFPSASTVLAKAIGLGATAPNKYPCSLEVGISLGFIDNILYNFSVNILPIYKFSYSRE
ncbi:hypothetical protein KUL156_52440 [Alteromonas sp. KUL156]|nr:hypothetical protein KUL154_07880 [Alteromonas sp. KUL154]GFE02652.1 hypothetical protein KUL156_52440 [Alteromonas sp. KUL156]